LDLNEQIKPYVSRNSTFARRKHGYALNKEKIIDEIKKEESINIYCNKSNLATFDDSVFNNFLHAKKLNIEMKLNRVTWSFLQPKNNLTSLWLQGCGIEHIDDNAFCHLTNLIKLNLSNNNIECITTNMFNGLKNLNDLRLIGCKIIKIEENAFNQLRELMSLYLCENPLEIIQDNFFGYMYQLHTLSFNNCNIRDIKPSAFSKLCRLSSLDLRGNPIQTEKKLKKEHFSGLENLERCNNEDISTLLPTFYCDVFNNNI
jgi:Leucine-rich repeat (LRR) protein